MSVNYSCILIEQFETIDLRLVKKDRIWWPVGPVVARIHMLSEEPNWVWITAAGVARNAARADLPLRYGPNNKH